MHMARLQMTRRALLGATAVIGLAVVPAAARSRASGLLRLAQAQAPSKDDLMAPGPLPEEAEGKPDAPVTMIEYASMTCPHCADFDVNVYPWLKANYIDTGKVRYIMREFPLDPLAAAAFMLARCAGDDKYFGMVDTLFHRQRDWMVRQPLQPLLQIAKQEGLTQASFDACLDNKDLLKGIDTVRQRAATKLGVDATPTFFINGKRYVGELTTEQLDAALKSELGS
jgi:protein-disulfide isomerase